MVGEQEENEPLPPYMPVARRPARRNSTGGDAGEVVAGPPDVDCDSWCHTSVSDDKVFEYVWTIDNFEKVAQHYQNSKTMYSEQFVVPLKKRFTVWRLKIYPNGRTPEDQGYITIFLKDSGQIEPAKVRAIAEFSIIDNLGNRTNIKTVDKEFKVLNHSFGFNKFVKHTDLFFPGSSLMKEGKLTLACRITIKLCETVNQTSQQAEYLESEQQECTDSVSHFGDMKKMLHNAQDYFSDVVISCQDGTIPCHSSILAARSPYFLAMFSAPMKEKLSRIIEIQELDKETCMVLLEYIYTGKISNEKITLCLFEAADKYNVPDLMSHCGSYLKRKLNRNNCIQTLICADTHASSSLKTATMDFILENSSVLTSTGGWKKELRNYPALLAELLEGMVSNNPQCKRSWIELMEVDGAPVAKRRRKH
jgi:hypothetical protein